MKRQLFKDAFGNLTIQFKRKAFIFFAGIFFISINLTGRQHDLPPDNLLKGQDPSVVYRDGFYYLVQSVNDSYIVMRKALTVKGLKNAKKVTVWEKQCCNVWAPELQYIRGKWYIYYTKDDGDNDHHRMFVLESSTDSPFGPYVDRGKIADPKADRWAIDGTVLVKDDSSLYFVWSGWEGKHNGQQNIYIAPMSNPYTISGSRVKISSPQYPWERVGMAINEGPQPIKKNGKYFIVFSASASWTDDYCLGMITNKDGDLLNPDSWVKSEKPVFSKVPTAYGPGHHCMVEGPDGQCWNIYHANAVSGSGWAGRTIRIQNFSWDTTDKCPRFDSPVPAEILINDTVSYN